MFTESSRSGKDEPGDGVGDSLSNMIKHVKSMISPREDHLLRDMMVPGASALTLDIPAGEPCARLPE